MRDAALIYWFSGTGHAWQVARQTKTAFAQQGIPAELRPAEEGPHPRQGKYRWICIVTAVYGFGLPDIMDRFLWDLPVAEPGQQAVVLAVTGHNETLQLGPLQIPIPPTEGVTLIQSAAYLRRRKYQIAGLERIEMPNTWILPVDAPDETIQADITAVALPVVDDFIAGVYKDRGKYRRIHPLPAIILGTIYLAFVVIGRRFLGKTFVATDRCTACGRCVAECPQNTIVYRNGHPDWHWDCQQCFRCIHRCPESAIEISAVSLGALFLLPWLVGKLLGFPTRKNRSFLVSILLEGVEILLGFGAVWSIDQWRKSSFREYLPDHWLTRTRRRMLNKDFQPARERHQARR